MHVVLKMEDAGIIKGSSLNLDYEKTSYSFIVHIGIYLEKNNMTLGVLKSLESIIIHCSPYYYG